MGNPTQAFFYQLPTIIGHGKPNPTIMLLSWQHGGLGLA